ncbi:E3 ubiquitin-protein ligase TRIM35-like [Cheilinus undulatus]|uniref:E3 ubiquitin-protein ligase TRIM35-like n=1 Tax=Cheilinus undulatus TaxID=241271 RepID=UPI001BD536A8|nr:E3 ubiquitin-protein ligase TRIM35-like [Cheilinus undulatus]
MASRSEEDFCCPACQDIFKDPVLLSCSHSFCRACLQSWWMEKQSQECPVCRMVSQWSDPPRNLALKNLCEAFLLKRGQGPTVRPAAVCHLHSERLKLFCLDDQLPVCVICRDAKIHTDHKFRPIEEAAQDRKEELQKFLKALQDKLKVFLEVRVNLNQTAEHIRVQSRQTERKVRDGFKRLHQFLQEEEEVRIAALREEEMKKSRAMKVKLEDLNREISALTDTIRATEEELRGDDVSFMLNYKDAEERVHQGLQLEDPALVSGALIDVASHLGNLSFNIWSKMKDIVSYSPVILDPNTANAELILSADLTSVRHGKIQQLPESPERFECWDSVLGSGFDSGSHCWDIEVGDNKDWEVGVLIESVCRRGFTGSTVWSLDFNNVKYRAFSPVDKYTNLPVRERLRRVRVHLDWDRGKLSFYDPERSTHLHTFTHTFTERMCPYICTRSTHPLKILPVKIFVSAPS